MPTLPPLRQLRYLVALTHSLHFGKAAESCAVTQSTLSAGIGELEEMLGVRVAERTKRSVLITPIGHRLAARAQAILHASEQLVEEARQAADPHAGPIALGTIPTIGPFILPRLIPYLGSRFPLLKFNLREDKTAPLLERLADGRLDVLMMAFPYDTDGCERMILFEDRYRFACQSDHALASRHDTIPLASLAEQQLMLLERDHCLHSHALPALNKARESNATQFSATSLYTLVAMVGEGLGTTLLPDLAINGGILQKTRVRVMALAGEANKRQIGLCWRKKSPRARTFRLLGEAIRTWAEGHLRPWSPRRLATATHRSHIKPASTRPPRKTAKALHP